MKINHYILTVHFVYFNYFFIKCLIIINILLVWCCFSLKHKPLVSVPGLSVPNSNQTLESYIIK